MKIKCSKCEFFKSKVHYLGYLVGTDSVQPLLEEVATIQALEPPTNIEELWPFLGLVRFYRKFIPFFADVPACLNTMLSKGAVFKWTEQCNNAFNLLKLNLNEIPKLQHPNPYKLFKLFTDTSKHNYLGILHQNEVSDQPYAEPNLVPIVYFSGSFSNAVEHYPKGQLHSLSVHSKIFILLSRHKMCTLL